MWNINKQILDASKLLNIEVKQLEYNAKKSVIINIANKYIKNDIKYPLWDKLNDSMAELDEKAWEWVEDFVGNDNVIIFFNPNDEKGAYLLDSGKDLVSILGEMYNIEFYLTNQETSYLICYNHHDVLLASGEAKFWLKEFNNRN